MKVRVHKIELLIVDFDGLGVSGVIEVLENTRYPNRCIAPNVMKIDTTEVVWDDDHPLNKNDTMQDEYHRLFGGTDTNKED